MELDLNVGIEGAPHALHAEKVILGAMMVEPIAIDDASSKLKEEAFHIESHRRIYRAILDISKSGNAVDAVTVSEALASDRRLDSIGGREYLASLSEGLPRKLSIDSYVRIVHDKFLLRVGMGIGQRTINRCIEGKDDAQIILAEAEAELQEAGIGVTRDKTLEEQALEEWELLERQISGEQLVFCTSGVDSFDVSHGGFALGELTVIAARPRIGKSTLVRGSINDNCEAGNFVHMFTPEMMAGQVHRCLWSMVARVPYHKLRHPERLGSREKELVKSAMIGVSGWPLKIDESSPLTPAEMIARTRRVKRKNDTKLAVLDYFQKFKYKGKLSDRHTEATDAITSLASLAKSEKVAMVVISSLTEASGKERNRMPTIDDLRQSGDIKFEANTVLLLHRETDAETQKLSPETQFIVGKARSDKDGSRRVYLDGEMQRFVSQDQFLQGIGK